MGWGDLDNGDLLDAMANAFDVLVTVDRGIPKQQQIVGRPLAGLVFRAKSNRIVDLLPLVPEALGVLGSLEQGGVAAARVLRLVRPEPDSPLFRRNLR